MIRIPLKDKDEIKIFILYLLENVGYPLDYNKISDIMIQDGIVGYFDYAECFAELVEAGHVTEEAADGVCRYRVSETGASVAEQLQGKLVPGIREMSLRSALRHLSFSARGAICDCDYTESEGRYLVHCVIRENGRNLLDTTIRVDTRVEAEMMMQNFRRKPEIVFRGMLALISGDVNYIFETN